MEQRSTTVSCTVRPCEILLTGRQPPKNVSMVRGCPLLQRKKNSGCGGTFVGEALLISANGKLGSCRAGAQIMSMQYSKS